MATTPKQQKTKKMTIAERRQKVAKLSVEGWTFEQMSDHFLKTFDYKVSAATLCRDAGYLAEKADKDAINEYITQRQIKLDQLAAQRKVLAHRVLVEKDPVAHKLWLEITDKEAKLLGLYAPIRVQVKQELETAVDQLLEDLERNISPDAFAEVLAYFKKVEGSAEAAIAN